MDERDAGASFYESCLETLHRNVKEDGNITHYYNLVPTVIISAATGFALGLFLHKLFQRIGV